MYRCYTIFSDLIKNIICYHCSFCNSSILYFDRCYQSLLWKVMKICDNINATQMVATFISCWVQTGCQKCVSVCTTPTPHPSVFLEAECLMAVNLTGHRFRCNTGIKILCRGLTETTASLASLRKQLSWLFLMRKCTVDWCYSFQIPVENQSLKDITLAVMLTLAVNRTATSATNLWPPVRSSTLQCGININIVIISAASTSLSNDDAISFSLAATSRYV